MVSAIAVRSHLTSEEQAAYDRNFEANKLVEAMRASLPPHPAVDHLEAAVEDLGDAFDAIARSRTRPARSAFIKAWFVKTFNRPAYAR